MNKSVYFLFLVVALFNRLSAQTFEIPPTTQPFYDILEWKGNGSIVLSRDPSFQLGQVTMTYVAGEGKSTWQETFNPMVKETYYIAEEKGKYVYFLEALKAKDNKIFFHQVSNSGNVKSTNVQFASALKRIGDYRADDMDLFDIVSTEKALVFMFRNYNKEKKSTQTIAVSMTHHNIISYAFVVAETITSSSKVDDQVSWYLAGENGENIVFAARTTAGKSSAWKIKEFDPKGKIVNEFSASATGTNFVAHARVGYGRRGSALMKKVEPMESGTLVYQNGTYFVGGVEVNGTSASLVTYQWKDATWVKVNSSEVKNYNAKKELQIGYFQLSTGISWFVKNTNTEGHYHPFDTAKKSNVIANMNQSSSNPSRVIFQNNADQFLCELGDKLLLFDPKQLGKKEAINFEYLKK